jgi:hypothetical protein
LSLAGRLGVREIHFPVLARFRRGHPTPSDSAD